MTKIPPQSNTKILFLGNEQLAQGLDHAICPSFEALIENHYQISALILPAQHFRKTPHIISIANSHQIPIHFIQKSSEIIPLIQKYHTNLGVLASFGKIIPQSVISAFSDGILNIHPSLLPKYRGTTPIETAILNGDSKTGVSIMQLEKAMDSGPIYAQAELPLTNDLSKQDIYERLAKLGSQLLIQLLPNYLNHTAAFHLQNSTQASFTQPLSKSDSILEPTKHPANFLARQIRAYLNFPKSKLTLLGIPCTITKAHAADSPNTILDPLCQDQKYLIIDQLIPPNSKPMSATAFLNGHKNRR